MISTPSHPGVVSVLVLLTAALAAPLSAQPATTQPADDTPVTTQTTTTTTAPEPIPQLEAAPLKNPDAGTTTRRPDTAAAEGIGEDDPRESEGAPQVTTQPADMRIDSLEGSEVIFKPMPPLPVPLTGEFAGSIGGVMIVAGGATGTGTAGDLSDATFSRDVYYLEPAKEGRTPVWKKAPFQLPEGVAFGATAVGADELICIGGLTAEGPTRKVVRIAWIGEQKQEQNSSFYVDPLTNQWHRVKEGNFYEVDGEDIALPENAETVIRKAEQGVPAHVELRTGIRKVGDEYRGLPDLPMPIAFAAAGIIDAKLYVVGGRVDRDAPVDAAAREVVTDYQGMLRVMLSQPAKPSKGPLGWLEDEVKQWRREEGVPPQWEAAPVPQATAEGQALELINPVVGVRRDAITEANGLWVMGGRRLRADGSYVLDRRIRRFIPGQGRRRGWTPVGELPEGIAPTSSVPLGHAHLLLLADDNSGPLGSLSDMLVRRSPRRLYGYHIYGDTWVDTTGKTSLRGGSVWPVPGGFVWLGRNEISGMDVATGALTGVEVGAAQKGEIGYEERYFGVIDFLVIFVYLGGMMLIGWYFSRRERNTDDYFLGGRKIPWWAAGLSIYATGISAISFMAIPAKTFHTDWAYIAQGIFPPIATVIVAYAFVPMLRRLRITTVMEYFELRFGKGIRVIGSLQVILFQLLARMNVVVMLPAIALAAVTGWPVWACILAMGILATIYTVLGGISAVIWTDVVQVLVIFGGAILSIFILSTHVDGGFAGIIDTGSQYEKFTWIYWDFDLTVASIWVFSIWAIGDMFARLGQENLQRAFATKDVKSARWSMITCGLVSIPGTLIFYFLGTSLFAYYQQNPAEINPTLGHDSIFPLFIAQKLPLGVAGLVVAGLFAAAMSTLDSGMNVVATIVTRDFFHFFGKDVNERRRLRAAQIVTLITGVFATATALYLANIQGDKGSLWDTFIRITAVVGGGFGGVIVMAMLSKRASYLGMLIGVLVGTAFTISLQVDLFGYPFKPFVFGTFSVAVTCLVTWLVSLAFPNRKDLTGLTVWTPAPEFTDQKDESEQENSAS